MARDFRSIVAWQRADDLAVEVYRRTAGLRRGEYIDLARQLRAAAVSVPANLAEGIRALEQDGLQAVPVPGAWLTV